MLDGMQVLIVKDKRILNFNGNMDTVMDYKIAVAVNKMLFLPKHADYLELRYLVFDNSMINIIKNLKFA